MNNTNDQNLSQSGGTCLEVDCLSPSELELVAIYERQQQLIRDRVAGVVHGYSNALYISGRTGTGKTYTIIDELKRHNKAWLAQNARMTAMGLFDCLKEHPSQILLLDDVPCLLKDKAALQILLAALDGDPELPRWVTYRSLDKDLRFEFSGRLILTGNVPIGHDPLARAVQGRAYILAHNVDDDVMAAYVRQLARSQYKDVSADDCGMVADFVIEETRACDVRLDLRHYFKGIEDFRQFRDGHAVHEWQTLVKSNLQKSVRELLVVPTKREEIEHELDLLDGIREEFPGDKKRCLTEFMARTGRKKTIAYERFSQLELRDRTGA